MHLFFSHISLHVQYMFLNIIQIHSRNEILFSQTFTLFRELITVGSVSEAVWSGYLEQEKFAQGMSVNRGQASKQCLTTRIILGSLACCPGRSRHCKKDTSSSEGLPLALTVYIVQ